MGTRFLNSLYITIPSTLVPLFVGRARGLRLRLDPVPVPRHDLPLIVALMVVPVQMAFVPLLKFFTRRTAA